MDAEYWRDVARAEIDHLHERVRATPIASRPWSHLVVENFFRPETYAALVEHFPKSPERFHPQSALDPAKFYGNAERRLEIRFPNMLDWLTPDERAFWEPFAEELGGPRFADVCVEKFSDLFHQRFGADADAPDFATRRLVGTFMLNRHEPEYALGPHTDLGTKVATCLFYMPEHAGLDHLGTTLYMPKERGLTSDGSRHLDPADFDRVAVVPFRPNTAMLFFRTDASFHGVEAFTSDGLADSARAGFQMSFYER